MKFTLPVIAAATFLSGAGVAGAKYLNFTMVCGSGSACTGHTGAVIFQGSVDVGTGLVSGTNSLYAGSATIFLNGAAYYGAGRAATTSGTVNYTCTSGGTCEVASVAGLTATVGTQVYSFTGSGADHSIIISYNSSEVATSLNDGCYPTGTGNCPAQNNPLSNAPEINGASLPKAVLLLGSLFMLSRGRRKHLVFPPPGQVPLPLAGC